MFHWQGLAESRRVKTEGDFGFGQNEGLGKGYGGLEGFFIASDGILGDSFENSSGSEGLEEGQYPFGEQFEEPSSESMFSDEQLSPRTNDGVSQDPFTCASSPREFRIRHKSSTRTCHQK